MFLPLLTFLIVLSLLILVHELGHFIAARRAGVWVEEFGFGFPPRILAKKVGETVYSINLLPLGGFVKLHGENKEEEIVDRERAFLFKGKLARTVIILAGVAMNFLLALLSFSLTYSFAGIPKETENVRIIEIRAGSPAERYGLQVGDIVRKIDGVLVKQNSDLISYVDSKKGEEITLTVEREGRTLELRVVPRKETPEGEGALGVVISNIETYHPPLWQRPFVGIYYGFRESLFWGQVVFTGFYQVLRDLFIGVVPKDIAGPVGIFALTTHTAQFGILAIINFIGVLSLNLAILNAVPFPALDGGRLLFVVLEAVIGKKISPKVEYLIHTVGIVILMLLVLAITARDIRKLIFFGGIAGYINSVLK